MKDLSPELQKLIADEKATLAPDPASVDAGCSQLLADVRQGVMPNLDVPIPDMSAPLVAQGATVISGKLVAVLAAAGVGAGVIGAAISGKTQASRIESAQVVMTEQPHPARTVPRGAENAAPVMPETRGSEDPPKPVADKVGPAREATFSRELSLIRQAQSALARGDSGSASALLSRHRREFPRGQFAQDRSALSALVQCQSGQAVAGKAAARAFIDSTPNSIYVDRLRNACLREK